MASAIVIDASRRALRLHPDKGGDPELFKEVTHAYVLHHTRRPLLILFCRYEILSDPQKRSVYDARGEAGLSEQGGMGGMDPQVRALVCTDVALDLS